MSPRNTGRGTRHQHAGSSIGVFAEARIRGGNFDRSSLTRHILTAAAIAFPLTIAALLLWTVPMTGAIR